MILPITHAILNAGVGIMSKNDVFELYFIIAAVFLFGLFLLLQQLIKMPKPRCINKVILMSLFFMTFSVTELFIIIFGNDKMFFSMIFYFMGTGLVSVCIYNRRLTKKCSEKITATYVFHNAGRGGQHHPIFRYTFNGENYKAVSQQTIENNTFAYEKNYSIYIKPNHPQIFIIYPKTLKNTTDLIITGVVIIAVGIAFTFIK